MSSETSRPTFKGDISSDARDAILAFSSTIRNADGFAHSTGARLVLREIEVVPRKRDERLEATVIYSITVDEDMVNPHRTLHGGCAAYLIDTCSSVAVFALGAVSDGRLSFVSQAINTNFLAPCPLGAQVELVNKTVSYGARIVSAVTEIWDVTNRRLCMVGTHVKMAPSRL